MRSDPAGRRLEQHSGRSFRSIACLVFVAIMGAAFWAGVLYIVQQLLLAVPPTL